MCCRRTIPVQIVHGSEVVIFHSRCMDTNGMRNLDGSLSVELLLGRQHPAKHGNVHCRMIMQQRVKLFLGGATLLLSQLADQIVQRLALLGCHMDRLLDFERRFFLQCTILFGNLFRPILGFLLCHTLCFKCLEHLDPQPLRTSSDAAGQFLLEGLGGTPRTLEALRGYPKTLHPSQTRCLGVSQIIPVQVGGRVGGKEMQLDELSHCRFSLIDSGSSAAAFWPSLR